MSIYSVWLKHQTLLAKIYWNPSDGLRWAVDVRCAMCDVLVSLCVLSLHLRIVWGQSNCIGRRKICGCSCNLLFICWNSKTERRKSTRACEEFWMSMWRCWFAVVNTRAFDTKWNEINDMSMHIHITNQTNEFGMFIKAACFSLLPNTRTSDTFGTHNVYICKLRAGKKKKHRERVEEKQNENKKNERASVPKQEVRTLRYAGNWI